MPIKVPCILSLQIASIGRKGALFLFIESVTHGANTPRAEANLKLNSKIFNYSFFLEEISPHLKDVIFIYIGK